MMLGIGRRSELPDCTESIGRLRWNPRALVRIDDGIFVFAVQRPKREGARHVQIFIPLRGTPLWDGGRDLELGFFKMTARKAMK